MNVINNAQLRFSFKLHKSKILPKQFCLFIKIIVNLLLTVKRNYNEEIKLNHEDKG